MSIIQIFAQPRLKPAPFRFEIHLGLDPHDGKGVTQQTPTSE